MGLTLHFSSEAFEPPTTGETEAAELSMICYMRTWKFASGVDRYVQMLGILPRWSSGQVTLKLHWTPTVSGGSVYWEGYVVGLGAQDNFDTFTWGSAIGNAFYATATYKVHTSNIGPFDVGSPPLLLLLKVGRVGTNVGDTNTGTAHLLSVVVYEG